MGIIKKLSESLANKIAAGEVVERPSSIVKELVENALDAGATTIQVDIQEGGLDKIHITDNGHGISAEDCEKAFERHATSKIKDEEDLFHIHSLGFRGEALPSIASVSHFDLITGTGEEAGRHLILEGGKLIQNKASDSRRGTEITVTRLFYNTPARLKHLKTIHTELAKISDIINKLALSFPKVSFKFTHNDKQIFKTNGKGRVEEVLAAIYGIQTAKASLGFERETLDFQVKGLLVKPEINRKGRQYVYVFINNRYIRNYPIFNAIISGYHTLLPIGRYPIAILHINLDPTLIDVNVHPAKLEARISKEKELCQLIETSIRETFHEVRLVPSVKKEPGIKRQKSEQQTMMFQQHTTADPPVKRVPQEGLQNVQSYPTYVKEDRPEEAPVFKDDESPEDQLPERDQCTAQPFSDEAVRAVEPVEAPEQTEPAKEKRMPVLYPIGQMHGTYILAQNENGLFIIDQHAAQERIKYEFYKEKVGQTAKELQELLVPMTFEFSAGEYAVISSFNDYLAEMGLYFESFGQNTYIVRSHPQWFPAGKEQETIEDIVQALLENKSITVKELREELAIMMSCKKSIKANRYLKTEEIDALLFQLSQASDPFTCPHGRPVIIHFTTYEMEKLFKRVM